ncbi:MAG: YceI family protein [Gammaproteobacteria bacterium]|nr:YceI family protein [Gammaproteobacteria bacterium]
MKQLYKTKTYSALLVSVMTVIGVQSAQATPIDLAKSTVTATGKQMGVPVTGKFKKMSGDVVFSPSQLATAKAKIDIDVGSYDMGMADYNQNVIGAEWFNAAKFPKASFVSTGIKAAAANNYVVSGQFSLKGKTQNVSFPVTVKTEGADQVFDGALTVKRNAFGVGSGDWTDTSVVADDVMIKFHIVAPIKK